MADVTSPRPVGWLRRAAVLATTAISVLGAVDWWQGTSQSVAIAVLLALPVAATVVPLCVRDRLHFRVVCCLVGIMLIFLSVTLAFLFLLWSFASGIILLVVAWSSRGRTPVNTDSNGGQSEIGAGA